MQQPMRTTIELTDRTYTRLRATAAERGMRGFSAIVEEALERLFEVAAQADLAPELIEAEGAWNESDVNEWERARREAWETWPVEQSSTPMS
jgi:hypothetical protein